LNGVSIYIYFQPFSRYYAKRIGVYEFDLSGSSDVIGHVIIGFPIGNLLLVANWNWNQASISDGFRFSGELM